MTTRCDVLAVAPLDECRYDVSTSCEREGAEGPVPLNFEIAFGHISDERLSAQIEYFESLRDMEVSFYQGGPMATAAFGGVVSMRESSGDLILLGQRTFDTAPFGPPFWNPADEA